MTFRLQGIQGPYIFRGPRHAQDRRAFTNQSLLELVEPPEWLDADALLAKMLDMQK
ncbi:MAG: hypothetical protein ACKV2U_04985 [Bryobacteraceae bacterium]